jgi:hypothetical protein
MRKIARSVLVFAVFSLACYGGIRLASDNLTERDGRRVVDTVHPFVKGVGAGAADKVKETLRDTPDEQLEKDAELLTRKFYPIAKGAIKGQLDAVTSDVNRAEVPRKAYEAGKNVSEKIMVPFSRGVTDGVRSAVGEVDQAVDEARKLADKNKDLIDAASKGLDMLGRLKEKLPPLPPPPPFGPPQRVPFPGQVDPFRGGPSYSDQDNLP